MYSVTILFSCQTYEGGFSAVPGAEAHGGYSFCGFAALVLLQESSFCDIYKLLVRYNPFSACFMNVTNYKGSLLCTKRDIIIFTN